MFFLSLYLVPLIQSFILKKSMEEEKNKKENKPSKKPPLKKTGGGVEVPTPQHSTQSDQEKKGPQPFIITPQKKHSEQQQKSNRVSKKETRQKTPPSIVPAPPQKNTDTKQPIKESLLSPLRTYKNDIAQTVKNKGASLSSMVIARRKKEGDTEAPLKQKAFSFKVVGLSALSLFLIVGGVVLIFFILPEESASPEGVLPSTSKDIIFIEEAKKIVLNRQTFSELIQKTTQEIKTATLPINTVQHTYLVKQEQVYDEGSIQARTEESLITFGELTDLLRANTPPRLVRALSPSFVFGIHSFTDNNPFLLMRVTSYENAFSGMLEWEKNILSDIAPLFSLSQENQGLVSSSFRDTVIENQDVRVLRGADDEVMLLYSFLDRNTLLITTHEVTLDEILERLKRPDARIQ